MYKTREKIENLKRDWSSDPCWDLEKTEGFEEHTEELLEYRLSCEKQAEKRIVALNLYDIVATKMKEINNLNRAIKLLQEED